MVFLSTTDSLDDSLTRARASGHTRFPLCEDDLDHVIGIVHIKDVFRAEPPPSSLAELRREIAFVPETMRLDRLLRRMRAGRHHLVAVLDEYGGVSGIVTLENVIEEIVGEIQDEFDVEPPELVRTGDGVYQVSGLMLVRDLEQELAIEFSNRDEDTIAGVVLSELGRRPRVGDRVMLGDTRLTVADAEQNRIKAVDIEVEGDE